MLPEGLMTMQDVTSNMVFVVALGQDPLGWSSLTFKDTVVERGRYYHPVGGSSGWPHTPPNYIGFRFDGRLQQVRHVDKYEVITRPHDYIPEIIPQADWTDEPHFLYTLGAAIVPAKPVAPARSGRTRLWCALDLLLTSRRSRDAREQHRPASTLAPARRPHRPSGPVEVAGTAAYSLPPQMRRKGVRFRGVSRSTCLRPFPWLPALPPSAFLPRPGLRGSASSWVRARLIPLAAAVPARSFRTPHRPSTYSSLSCSLPW